MLDVVVRGGTIVDGSGDAARSGDVGIRDGRIVALGQVDEDARKTIDASGKIVAPGFIDIHTHYDAQVHWDPYCTISGWHGVTSVAIGNCGFGFAPAKPEMRERLFHMMTRTEQIPFESMVEGVGLDWDWETLPEWMATTIYGDNCFIVSPNNSFLASIKGSDFNFGSYCPRYYFKVRLARFSYSKRVKNCFGC